MSTQNHASKFVKSVARNLGAELKVADKNTSVLNLDATDLRRKDLRQAIRSACVANGVCVARGHFNVHTDRGHLMFGVHSNKNGWQATITPAGSPKKAALKINVSFL